MNPPYIVCAANRHNDSKLVICGARHFDSIMRAAMKACGGFPYWLNCEQGFIDDQGTFYTREEAWEIAKEKGQIRREVSVEGTLFSENLY